MVRLKGFEPLTARFVAEYSIQLSYRRIFCEDALSRFMLVALMYMAEKLDILTIRDRPQLNHLIRSIREK
jgi:hypothetical protein